GGHSLGSCNMERLMTASSSIPHVALVSRSRRFAVCVAFALLFLRHAAAGERQSPQFDELLAAGEFAPALKLAQDVADPAGRDQLLVKLAAAQNGAGARNAALSTLAGVSDDRTRYSALQSSSQSSPPSSAGGARGGAQADFSSLIELITTTVKPSTWDE